MRIYLQLAPRVEASPSGLEVIIANSLGWLKRQTDIPQTVVDMFICYIVIYRPGNSSFIVRTIRLKVGERMDNL